MSLEDATRVPSDGKKTIPSRMPLAKLLPLARQAAPCVL
jgi:hypothetical protein